MKKQILAICGSTRQRSTNHNLIQAITEFTKQDFEIRFFEELAALPHFNPDEDNADVTPSVTGFRQQLQQADGILICTPEYAHGVPGALKNAIDWTVSSCEFSGKPTILITASTDGKYAHQALLETLRVIEAGNIDELNLLIPFAQTKINRAGKIVDDTTLREIQQLMQRLKELL
ncbi:NAD(P)H-dependent oxidoreductase (plasmid) [Pedobacter sp. BS3]|uniref:NADPH-dependent FMN reductase n=1 Tax=Pedobacter sp. BS3 TaxID=2567937 RepID=UPI0011EDCD0A|nr:NADPH-dependent FMN reductase [Pedobacter sp. BS3]TZF85681.1 NAD(P)H-dependent oxidoreductase [Pedobacter sp. BS3]